jgi:glyoxylase-like metal-dependent hydrolase (beta-lactamase superfamily II)
MNTTTVTPNAVQLTRLGFVNCYLVRETDGLTLVDTGLSGSSDDILAAARALNAPITRILLTHAHVDHVGSVDELVAKLPSVEVASSARSLPLLQQPPDKSLAPGEPKDAIKGGLPGIKTRPTHLITDGELYGSLRCIETPGHIPGHLSFLDERDGTLYAGDALVAKGRLAISGYAPWYFPLPNFATWNKTLALASANKLLAYPIERFACGHGSIKTGDLRTAIAQAT